MAAARLASLPTTTLLKMAVKARLKEFFWPADATPFGSWVLGAARTHYNYAADVGDGLSSSVVMPVIQWIQRAFPEAVVIVERRQGDDWEEQRDHPLPALLNRPNPFYSGAELWMTTVRDWCWFGEAYWRILESVGGEPAELVWLPPWSVTPQWPSDGRVFISHYEYRPDVSGPAVELPVEKVVHFRHGLDPRRPRHGLPPLRAVLQEVWIDQESNHFVGSILRNMGIPGIIISPKGADATLSPEEVERVKQYIDSRLRGDGRGSTLAFGAPTDVQTLSLTPGDLDLSAHRNTAEERVCCIPDTMVMTPRGLIAIQDVQVGDQVMTHRGRWRAVRQTFAHEVSEDLFRFTAQGLDPLTVTGNHLVRTGLYRKPHQTERLTYGGSQWVRADAIRPRLKKNQRSLSHALTLPVSVVPADVPYLRLMAWIPRRRQWHTEFLGMVLHASSRVQPLPAVVPMNAALGRLLGFYTAEGSKGDSRLYWAFHANEVAYHQMIQEDLRSLFGIESHVVAKQGLGVQVVAQSAMLRDLFPSGTASQKCLPAWAWLGGDEFRQALVWAWAAGDGSTSASGVRVTTVSAHLARQMQLMAISCGFAASVQKQSFRSNHGGTIRGRTLVRRHPAYIVRWHRRFNPKQAEYHIEPDGYWTSIVRCVETIPYTGFVHNLAVEEDESYLTTGGLVHNCSALGIPAAVIGFGTGLETTKVGATMAEMRKIAWQNGIIPVQMIMAAAMARTLLPWYETDLDRVRVSWDYKDVQAMQEDEAEKRRTMTLLWDRGLVTRQEAREILGFKPGPEDDVYMLPVGVHILPSGDAPPAPTAQPAANGNGNGQPAQRALTGVVPKQSLDEWLTESIGRRASRLDKPPASLSTLATRLMREEKRLQPEFQRRILAVLRRYGEHARAATREIFPKQANLEDIVRMSIILERLPLSGVSFELAQVYEELADRLVDQWLEIYKDAVGVVLASDVVLRQQVRQAVAQRVTLLDLTGEAKDRLLTILDQARQEGLGEDAVVQMVADTLPSGRWTSPEMRAQVLARTEARYLANVTSARLAESAGFGKVLLLDALLGDTDQVCMERAGWVVSPSEARALAATEHPNGTLMIIPLPTGMTVGAPR